MARPTPASGCSGPTTMATNRPTGSGCVARNSTVTRSISRAPRSYAVVACMDSELLGDDFGGTEILPGELDDHLRIERLAGVDVDAEELHRPLPGVEVRA